MLNAWRPNAGGAGGLLAPQGPQPALGGGYQLGAYDPKAAAMAAVLGAKSVPTNPSVIDPFHGPGAGGDAANAGLLAGNNPNPLMQHDPSAFGGGGMPGTGGAYGENQRGTQQYGRGQADLTLHNLMAAGRIAGSFMGPMGALMGAATLARNPSPFTGFVGATPAGRAILASGGTLAQAQAADHAHAVAQAGAAMSNNAIASGNGMHVGHPGGGGNAGQGGNRGGYGGTGGKGGPNGGGFGN